MKDYPRTEERTGVQESGDFEPVFDVQSDFVMVYGFHDLKNRIKKWKKAGYVIHLMTGVSWGNYQDYLFARWDGINHRDEGQKLPSGEERAHGPDVPYMVPSNAFAHYLADGLKYAVDCGVEAIHLEEPEFWVETGYSDAFKREWKIYYKEDWIDPQSSCDAQYRASKLKQYLYTRTLDRLCSELKEYAMVKYGRLLRFYVPTHSLINYTQWKIVSPESALIDLPTVDGYIAQIWTGTSRERNYFRGVRKERTFETAFLEYGVMQELVRGTGRRMWYLADPIEDNPRFSWQDYRANYYRTVVASLFHPEISDYEVSPWPRRVMKGRHEATDETLKARREEFRAFTEAGGKREDFRPSADTMVTIPPEYKTNLLTVMHTLRDMADQGDIEWPRGNREVAVALADSAMFQRICPGEASYGSIDAGSESGALEFSPFYGLALPLVKAGIAARPVQLDNIRRYPAYLDSYKTLVLSYEFMKPASPDINEGLSGWVKNGGTLVLVGDGSDPFHRVREWWNSGANRYDTPTEHLTLALGIGKSPADGLYEAGSGRVLVMNVHPAKLAKDAEASDDYRDKVLSLLGGVEPSATLDLRRGVYRITARMDETSDESDVLEGDYIDLFADCLPVVEDPELKPDSVGLWYDVRRIDKSEPAAILALSGRAEKLEVSQRSLKFTFRGPSEMTAQARIWTKRPPKSVKVAADGEMKDLPFDYEPDSETSYFTFPSDGKPIKVSVSF